MTLSSEWCNARMNWMKAKSIDEFFIRVSDPFTAVLSYLHVHVAKSRWMDDRIEGESLTVL